MRIFLLEDDRRVADSIIGALETRGHKVQWVSTILNGVHILEQDQNFDLGILDFNIGVDKGTDLIPKIKFPYVGYSGLPRDMAQYALRKGISGLNVFSKGDPFALLDYIENFASNSYDEVKAGAHTGYGG